MTKLPETRVEGSFADACEKDGFMANQQAIP